MKTKLRCALVAFALAMPTAARAQVLFDITPSALSGAPGSTITFSGTLTNTGNSPVFINGDQFLMLGADVTIDDSKFLAGFPASLAPSGSPGSSASGALFDAVIDPSAAPGDNPGSFTVLGGITAADLGPLANHDFLVSVTPEPGAAALLVGAALSGLTLRRRRA